MNKELLDITRIRDFDKFHSSIIEFCKLYNVVVNLTSEYSIDYKDGKMSIFKKSITLDDLIQHDKIMCDQGFSFETKFNRVILKCKIENIKREYSIFLT